MRLLSQSEYSQLDAVSEIPVDLAARYFPVTLRAYAMEDDLSPAGERLIKDADIREALERVDQHIGSKPVYTVTKNSDGKKFHDQVIQAFDWYSFSFEHGPRKNCTGSRVVMFPVDHLLFSRQLRELDIKAQPGYLYFAAVVYRPGQDYYNPRGSIMLGENWYNACQAELDTAFREDFVRGEWTIVPNKEGKAQLQPGKKNYKSKLDQIPPWYGPIADVAHVTNSRIMASKHVGPNIHYILETPFEFPPGFVRETADTLKRQWRATSALVDKFCDLTFGKTVSRKADKPAVAASGKAVFPHGEPKLEGPDTWWKKSANPWLVQTLLLARLIGGNFWQYALGNLELNMQASVESLDFPNE